jgi:hypothetical protein
MPQEFLLQASFDKSKAAIKWTGMDDDGKILRPGVALARLGGAAGEMAEWFKAHAWKMRNTFFSSHH